MSIAFYDVKQAEGILDELSEVKEKLENKINLSNRVGNEKKVTLPESSASAFRMFAAASCACHRMLMFSIVLIISKIYLLYYNLDRTPPKPNGCDENTDLIGFGAGSPVWLGVAIAACNASTSADVKSECPSPFLPAS